MVVVASSLVDLYVPTVPPYHSRKTMVVDVLSSRHTPLTHTHTNHIDQSPRRGKSIGGFHSRPSRRQLLPHILTDQRGFFFLHPLFLFSLFLPFTHTLSCLPVRPSVRPFSLLLSPPFCSRRHVASDPV